MTGRGGTRMVRTARPVAAVACVIGLLAMAGPAAAEVDADGNRRLGPVGDRDGGGRVGTAAVEVDDPLREAQWYLDHINAPQAWELTRGEAEVTVAVVDTGVDHGHQDLTEAFWVDGRTGTAGYDFVRDTPETYVGPEQDWHGTAVAGVLAARADDGYGMAGVAPQVRLQVYRIYRSESALEPPNAASYTDAADGIRTAVDNGADVVLLTWGGTTPSAEVFRAIRDARVPVVVAAGNDGQDLSGSPEPARYPATYRLPNMVTVAASGADDGLLAGDDGTISNYGVRHVDLAAPGQEIVSLTAGGEHELFEGTSFAAPQVAAALALGRSLYPDASTNEMVGTLVRTARPAPRLDGRVTSHGVLDVEAFLWGISRPACGEGIDPVEFDDVPPDATHAGNIACVVSYGISRGVDEDRFAPHRSITRAEMAAFLVRTLERAGADLPEDPPSPFEDTADSIHADAIDVLAEVGITDGVDDTRFDPRGTVSRGQMTAFIVRTIEHLLDTRISGDRWWFDDIDGHTHEQSIVIARDLGITLGASEPRLFAPDNELTRAQMASFLARKLDFLGQLDVTVDRPS